MARKQLPPAGIPTRQLDALGQPILVGGYYGYTTGSNGVTHVVVGTVVDFTEDKIRLKPDSVKTSYGGKTPEPRTEWRGRPTPGNYLVTDHPARSLMSLQLFPVAEEQRPCYHHED